MILYLLTKLIEPGSLLRLLPSEYSVIFFMIANPYPYKSAFMPYGKSPVISADASRPYSLPTYLKCNCI